MTTQPSPYRRFKHYKGGIYHFLYLAKHEATHEMYVVYRDEKNPDSIYIRTQQSFEETVDTSEGQVPRFKFLG